MLLQLSHFFLSLYSPPPCTSPPTIILPPYFMSMGHTYKFFGFSISHTIPNLPYLFCIYNLCFLFLVTFPPFYPLPLPVGNPPCDFHFCDSVPVLVVCLVCFCFCFFLGLIVDSCEFVVILLFVFLIFFFLDKCL